jgi:hypothetical protein
MQFVIAFPGVKMEANVYQELALVCLALLRTFRLRATACSINLVE